MKVSNPEQEVDAILAEVDKNNSGYIDYHGTDDKKNL
jgi:Ca2+-binding EF-hand superfamily protein